MYFSIRLFEITRKLNHSVMWHKKKEKKVLLWGDPDVHTSIKPNASDILNPKISSGKYTTRLGRYTGYIRTWPPKDAKQ